MIRLSSKYGPMSKSFCRFGLANGSVDDDADADAVSGNAIDDGELISSLDATISIRFSATGKRVCKAGTAANFVVVVAAAAASVVKFNSR